MTAPLGAVPDTGPGFGGLQEQLAQVAVIRPRIDTNRQMSQVVEDAVRALVLDNGRQPKIFQAGGRLARIATETDESSGSDIVLVKHLGSGALRGHLARVATWIRAGQNGDTDVPPPKEVVEDLLGNADIFDDLPVLRQVVHCPVFAKDGTLHAEPGYSEATRCWYEPRGDLRIEELPLDPTHEEIVAARDLLALEYLGDFPFEDPADRAHALALALLPFIRPLIPGPTPLHLIEASTPGTGKGLLGKAIFLLSHGADIPSMTEARDDGEWSKALTAKFATGQPIIFIDNVSRTLNSAKLAAALTQPIWEDRLLGGSRMLVVPIRHVFVATGNNVSMSGELARRTVRCRLNAHVERPWLRSGFRHADLMAWGAENRARLVRAALILARAWLVRGRPNWSGRPLGSYEDWSRTLGGILEVAGSSAFLGNLQKFYDATVDDGDDERPLVLAWYEKLGEKPALARDLVEIAAHADSGGGGLDSYLDRMSPKQLGQRLRKLHGRVYGDLEVTHIKRAGKADQYKLTRSKDVAAGDDALMSHGD